MTQYNLASNYIDVLVADASLHQLWRQQTLFDTIITDRKLRNRFLGSRLFFAITRKLFCSKLLFLAEIIFHFCLPVFS